MSKSKPQLDEQACLAAQQSYRRWLRTCTVQDERTGDLFRLRPSSTQAPVVDSLADTEDWPFIVKPRQSHTSTACTLFAVHRTEYFPGRNALLVADKYGTAKELSSRVATALMYQDPSIAVPRSKEGIELYEFAHRGKLLIGSAVGKNTGVGHSIDTLVLSEFGLWDDAGPVLQKLMPAVLKRPGARVVIETTPGTFGSAAHRLHLDTVAGATRFRSIFIAWHEHAAYTREVPLNFVPDLSELRLLEQYPRMTLGHLAFRREVLSTVCHGDERLFANQYPSDVLDGWTTTSTPALPEAAVRALLPGIPDPAYLQGWGPPHPGHRYLLVADPNSYGSAGDPSAYSLWDGTARVEVAAFSGRVDPVKFGADLVALARRYNDALLVIESNAAACITAAKNTGYRNIWHNHSSADHPGWYRTSQAKERAIAALVDALSRGHFRIWSAAGLAQVLSYDGTDARKDGHHWDRLVTYQIAADIFTLAKFPPPVVQSKPLTVVPQPVRLVDMKRDIERRAP